MAQPKIYEGTFFEGRKFWIMDRPQGTYRLTAFSGDISATYLLTVYDVTQKSNPTLVHTEASGKLTEFATLQTDGYWSLDDDGYSMRIEVDPEAWSVEDAVGGRSYLLRMLYTSAAWGKIPLFWLLKCERDPNEVL